jgi:hypothetical protein
MKKPDQGLIEIEAYYTWMGEDGIARTEVKPNVEVGLQEAMENSEVINALKPSNKYPLIIDAKLLKSMTKEARDHFSLKGRDSNVSSFAIIVGSPLSRTIANFFINLSKPEVPTKLFTSEEKALSWTNSI